eukprot:6594995-Pyramimonas_sp.AAC.2
MRPRMQIRMRGRAREGERSAPKTFGNWGSDSCQRRVGRRAQQGARARRVLARWGENGNETRNRNAHRGRGGCCACVWQRNRRCGGLR